MAEAKTSPFSAPHTGRVRGQDVFFLPALEKSRYFSEDKTENTNWQG